MTPNFPAEEDPNSQAKNLVPIMPQDPKFMFVNEIKVQGDSKVMENFNGLSIRFNELPLEAQNYYKNELEASGGNLTYSYNGGVFCIVYKDDSTSNLRLYLIPQEELEANNREIFNRYKKRDFTVPYTGIDKEAIKFNQALAQFNKTSGSFKKTFDSIKASRTEEEYRLRDIQRKNLPESESKVA